MRLLSFSSSRRRAGFATVAAIAAAALAGCDASRLGQDPSVWRAELDDPVKRQIRLDVAEETRVLEADAQGLAVGEAARLGEFLAAQGSPYGMDVLLRPLTPEGAAALPEVAEILRGLGVQSDRIAVARAEREVRALLVDAAGDIAVTARFIEAAVPDCPDWRRANLIDHSELNSSNFGCATAANLARMVADPRELAGGRALAPASGKHAAEAVARYRAGKVQPLLENNAQAGGGGGK